MSHRAPERNNGRRESLNGADHTVYPEHADILLSFLPPLNDSP